MPPCEPVFQVIELGRDGENLEKEKLSMETTVRNVHLRNPYFRIPRDFNETWLAKVNLGRPPLEPWRPKRRQNVITALTTLPQGWDLTRKNQCTTAISTMWTESSWVFLRATLPDRALERWQTTERQPRDKRAHNSTIKVNFCTIIIRLCHCMIVITRV